MLSFIPLLSFLSFLNRTRNIIKNIPLLKINVRMILLDIYDTKWKVTYFYKLCTFICPCGYAYICKDYKSIRHSLTHSKFFPNSACLNFQDYNIFMLNTILSNVYICNNWSNLANFAHKESHFLMEAVSFNICKTPLGKTIWQCWSWYRILVFRLDFQSLFFSIY